MFVGECRKSSNKVHDMIIGLRNGMLIIRYTAIDMEIRIISIASIPKHRYLFKYR